MNSLIVIEGTTASGKSGLGIELARRLGGEIVSADSRQVFRGLDLGSGKVTPEEMQGVPHHLLDVCDPGEFFSMADFQRLAYQAIDDIAARGRPALMVGGTGLYVDAVAMGYLLSDKAPDLAYRAELETYETPALYAMLLEKCPGCQVDGKNRNRVMRMLEKLHAGDDACPSCAPRYRVLRLGVTWPREEVKRRIDERLDARFQAGMLEEVQGLMAQGVNPGFLLGLGLEYRFLTQYLIGEITEFEDMKEQLSRAIKRFAGRQMTWFRRHPDTHWLDMGGDSVGEALALIEPFLNSGEKK